MLIEKLATSNNIENISLAKYQVKALEDLEEVCYSHPKFINNDDTDKHFTEYDNNFPK